jgi:hypothetical protein
LKHGLECFLEVFSYSLLSFLQIEKNKNRKDICNRIKAIGDLPSFLQEQMNVRLWCEYQLVGQFYCTSQRQGKTKP